jgi:hypothetical protein
LLTINASCFDNIRNDPPLLQYIYICIIMCTLASISAPLWQKNINICVTWEIENRNYICSQTATKDCIKLVIYPPPSARPHPPVYLHVSFCVLQLYTSQYHYVKKKYNFVSHGNSRIEITCSQTATKYCIQSVIYPPPDPNM